MLGTEQKTLTFKISRSSFTQERLKLKRRDTKGLDYIYSRPRDIKVIGLETKGI